MKVVGECIRCGWCCSNIYTIKDVVTGEEYKGYEALSKTKCATCGIDSRYRAIEEVTKCKYLGEDNNCIQYNKRTECCKNYPLVRDIEFDKVETCGYRLEEG